MKSCRFALCVLLFLTTTRTTVFETTSDDATVRAKANASATLPCSGNHSGSIEWVKLQDTESVVAECGQDSCWSKAGYQISHDQYLKKNFSLNVVGVDPNNTGSYKCKNEDRVISAVVLQNENSSLVKAELHGSAVLHCNYNCSGEGRWIRNYNYSDVLAECDQVTCGLMKKGYQMIHDQYLNLSLTITDVDYTKTGCYTCQCDRMSIIDVQLQINALSSSVQVKPGESLLLELDIPDSVEVVYNSTGAANGSSGQICMVDGRSLQCRSEYSQRTSLSSAVELRGMNVFDSGVYTVRDTENKEDIHVYTVSVRDEPNPDPGKGAVWPVWVCLYVSLAVNGLLVVIVLLVTCMKKKSPCGKLECVLMKRVLKNRDANQCEEEDAIPPPDLP